MTVALRREKYMLHKAAFLIFASLTLVVPSSTNAQTFASSDAVEKTRNGSINWTVGEVYATGMGAPPSTPVNPGQARAMAERAAFVVAVRNLLETVKGVRVDSETLVENFLVKSDRIRTRVDGIVRGARIVKRQYLPDGSVEVLVSLPMKGAFLNSIAPENFGKSSRTVPVQQTHSPAPQKSPDLEPSVPVQTPVPGKKQPLPEKPDPPAKPLPDLRKDPMATEPGKPSPLPQSGPIAAFKGGTATGVVIDGRGLGLRPALLPRIVDEQGREIYVGQVVTRTNAVEQGVAGYARDVNAAANNFRVTDNPAVIKGLRAVGASKTDIVLAQADAETLRQLSYRGDFLQYCRVIIVY